MSTTPRQLWWHAAWVFAVVLAAYAVRLDHNGFYDEFYHVLAARSWLEDGTFRVGGGTYDRSSLFTILVALAFGAVSESLVTARAVSAVAAAGLVTCVFAWTARVSNVRAGYLAAGLLAVTPVVAFVSQIVRFYALHGLLFWVATVLVYGLAASRLQSPHAWLRALAATLALVGAFALQATTLIGVLGLATGAVALWSLRPSLPPGRRSIPLVVRALVLLGLVVVLVLMIDSEHGRHYLSRFRAAPLWASGSKHDPAYYHWWFLENYPTLWALLPVALLAALTIAPRPVLFCAVTFAVIIGLHSIAGTKGDRYIAYALPLFFVTWGIALSAAVDWTAEAVRTAQRQLFGKPLPLLLNRIAQVVTFLGIAVFLLASNPAFRMTAKMLVLPEARWPNDGPEYRGTPDWRRAAELLALAPSDPEVVVVSAGVKALYFLGRFDYDLSATNVQAYGHEFAIDDRTGGRLISSADSMRRVMQDHATGLVVIEQRHWRNSWAVDVEAADFIEANAQRVALPPELRLLAFRWHHAMVPVAAPSAEKDEMQEAGQADPAD